MPFRDAISPLISSRTLGYVTCIALAVGLYSCLPVWKENSPYKDIGDMPSQFHAALSLVLGALLVFRTNSAYARWWEARTLWGSLVNASRNLALKLTTFGKFDAKDYDFLSARIREFPQHLKEHLRSPGLTENSRADGGSSAVDHRPAAIVHDIYRLIADKKRAEQLDGQEMRTLDVELARFMDVCGGCERIARTPIVRSYRIFARQCILLFLFTLPWGIASDFGWWTIPLSVITAYFMIGMETVAEHVEEPFGLDEDDLDLEGLCAVIEKSVHEIFSRTQKTA